MPRAQTSLRIIVVRMVVSANGGDHPFAAAVGCRREDRGQLVFLLVCRHYDVHMCIDRSIDRIYVTRDRMLCYSTVAGRSRPERVRARRLFSSYRDQRVEVTRVGVSVASIYCHDGQPHGL